MFLGLLLNIGGDRYPQAVPRANLYLILQPLSHSHQFHFPILDIAWASAASSLRSSERPVSIAMFEICCGGGAPMSQSVVMGHRLAAVPRGTDHPEGD
jgi:hypothetical protein